MSSTQAPPRAGKAFFITLYAFACCLGGLAAWIVAAELLRSTDINFTTDGDSAALIYEHRDRAI